jgi:hypothetical protein
MITRYEVVYNSSLKVKPGTMITITIDPFGRANVDESRIGRESFDRDTYWDRDHGYDNDHDGKWGDYDSNEGYERAMEDRQFNQVLESISKEWLESNKLKSATQIVRSNYVTSAQVTRLVSLFGFESNKLELAKQAYANTVDKRNYFMVSDEFSFSSSKDELARYIRNLR